MPTLLETMRDVLAHPENYAEAFTAAPVELPDDQSMWVYPTMFELQTLRGGVPDSAVPHQVGVLREGEPIFGDLQCSRCGLTGVNCVLRRRSTLAPPVEYNGIGDPDPEVAICLRCLEMQQFAYVPSPFPTLNAPVDTSLSSFTPADLESARIGRIWQSGAYNRTPRGAPFYMDHPVDWGRRANEAAMRPDHYRVRDGLCSCGFTAMFRADMDSHLADDLFTGPDGVPRRWRVCGRCQASAACREVRVGNLSPFQATEHAIVLCDNCTLGEFGR